MPRGLLRAVLAAVVATSTLVSVAEPASPSRGGGNRPNIVLILTDDQTIEQMAALPRTQELLGGNGITFTEAVASYPLCCPSRATILTGQYVQNNGVRQNLDAHSRNQLPTTEGVPEGEGYSAFVRRSESHSVAVALQRAGYHTGLLGKYLNGYPVPGPVPPGWTDWRAAEEAPDSYWDTTMNVNGRVQRYRNRFQTDLYAQLAMDMIDDASASGRPFFLSVNFSAPHVQRDNRPAFADRHALHDFGVKVPRTAAYDERDYSDKPAFLRDRFRRMTRQQRFNMDAAYRNGFRSLRSVDEAIERIVDRLAARGELENTNIVFMSDNGQTFGEHRLRQYKYLPYEPIVRIPLIVAGPAVAPSLRGTESDLAVVNTDITPTILDLADAPSLATMDGRSLVPVLRGTPGPWQPGASPTPAHPRPVYIVGIAANIPGSIPTYSGVRTSDGWKYVRWEDPRGARELYDLDADPLELNNLARRPAYRHVVQRLERQRRLLARCVGRSCHAPPYGYLDLPHRAALPRWFPAARWADSNGLGVAFRDGTFRPKQVPTRLTALAWLWREAGRPRDASPHPYVDVPRASAPVVNWAFAQRIVRPTSDRRLQPDARLTRAQWADMLWRAVGRPPAGSAALPSDVNPRSVAAPAIRWLVADPPGAPGPIAAVDSEGGFHPGVGVTRSLAMIWLHAAIRRR